MTCLLRGPFFFAACTINKMTPYELSTTSVQSSKVASSRLTWYMHCFSLLYKVLGVCVRDECHCLGFVGVSTLTCLCLRFEHDRVSRGLLG